MRLLLLALVATSAPALAANVVVATTGYVLDGADQPLDGSVTIAFALYDDPTATDPLDRVWPASGPVSCSLAVSKGFYATGLGAGAAGCGTGLTDAAIPPDATRWLEVTIGGVTLSPRTRLDPLPSASRAGDSAKFDGRTYAQLVTALDAIYAPIGHVAATTGVHGVTGSVVGTSDVQALTNKTLDATANTVRNLDDATLAPNAGIARTKVAPGVANQIVVNAANGSLSSVGVLDVARGGTGATTAAGGLTALSPLAAKGDLLVTSGGGTHAALAAGTNGQVLTADSTATYGVRWGTAAASGAKPPVVTSPDCTAGHDGELQYVQAAGTLVMCFGTNPVIVAQNSVPRGCKEILAINPSESSGLKTVSPDGTAAASISVYCDYSTFRNGTKGWMLLAVVTDNAGSFWTGTTAGTNLTNATRGAPSPSTSNYILKLDTWRQFMTGSPARTVVNELTQASGGYTLVYDNFRLDASYNYAHNAGPLWQHNDPNNGTTFNGTLGSYAGATGCATPNPGWYGSCGYSQFYDNSLSPIAHGINAAGVYAVQTVTKKLYWMQ